jgi:biopolymer transport protein ExbB
LKNKFLFVQEVEMKKLLILAMVSCAMVSAEETSLNILSFEPGEDQPPALEQLADQQIELFFEEEMAPAPTSEVATDEISFLSPSELPDLSPKESLTVQREEIKINSELAKQKSAPTPAPIVQQVKSDEPALVPLSEAEEQSEIEGQEKLPSVMIDMEQVFYGSPFIYSLLLAMSVGALCIWSFMLLSLRTSEVLPETPLQLLREKLTNHQYDEALALCEGKKSFFFKMIATGISTRDRGPTAMLDLMKAEGRRATNNFWQKIALLNDVAIIAPMLGLLGTVLGMFYAFYDLNRSMESISALFDGLGISVGTTLAGLAVSIVAMVFYSMTKYRLMKQLTLVENEAQAVANLIDAKRW